MDVLIGYHKSQISRELSLSIQYSAHSFEDATVMRRALVLASVCGIAFSSCKPRAELSATQQKEGAAGEGAACPAIDVVKLMEKDREKAFRVMGFLYRMMLRGNGRAGALFLAAVEGVTLEDFTKGVDNAIKSGKLLAANDGASKEIFSDASKSDMDQAINEDVELRAIMEIMESSRKGKTVKLTPESGGLNLAKMSQRFGEIAKQTIAANPASKARVQSEFESMIQTAFDVEAGDVQQTEARRNLVLALDQIVESSRIAGLETQVTDSKGQVKRVSAVSDAALTRGYLAAMGSMTDSMLAGSTKTLINKLDFFYNDFAKLSGNERVFEGTGMEELRKVLRQDQNSEEYKKLRTEGTVKVGGKDVSVNDITNPDKVISKLRESGKGELIMDAMRKKYGKEAERR